MKKITLERLFSKEKRGMEPESSLWINLVEEVPKQQAVIMEKPGAAIYLRFSSRRSADHLWDQERDCVLRYCEQQGYKVLVVIESIGVNTDLVWEKIQQLENKGLIDVVVFPRMSRLSRHFDKAEHIFESLYYSGVKVDCMGIGIIEPDRFRDCVMRSYQQEPDEEIQEIIEELLFGSGARKGIR